MPNILVIDDDVAIRTMFVRALKAIGTVEEAKNGAEALSLLAHKRFDVLILDWNMPIVDGPAVLRALEKPGLNRETPIIVVTADMTQHARVESLRQGALFFLNKPVQLSTLGVFVTSTIGKKRS